MKNKNNRTIPNLPNLHAPQTLPHCCKVEEIRSFCDRRKCKPITDSEYPTNREMNNKKAKDSNKQKTRREE